MKRHLQLFLHVEADVSQQQLNEQRALHELYNIAAQHGGGRVGSSHSATTDGVDLLWPRKGNLKTHLREGFKKEMVNPGIIHIRLITDPPGEY